jgi:hypothetical protein
MSLSREQRDNLHRLLAAELEDAWRSAAGDGAGPDELADMVDERRRAVRVSAEPVGEKTVRRVLG